MAFDVDDFQALVRLLDQHPEWRAELRRLVLTDERGVWRALDGRVLAPSDHQA